MIARTRQGRSPHSRASTITSEGQIEVAAAAGGEAVVVVDVDAASSALGRTELKDHRSCVPVVSVSAIGVDCGWSS
jgi:acyl dehydratase